jgi:hypothetical protein
MKTLQIKKNSLLSQQIKKNKKWLKFGSRGYHFEFIKEKHRLGRARAKTAE